ncbi:hypothetical protein CF319_g4761 [Tilletia indica]|nr:hypothetical protein CF319_g4761 [Tilletia indica]
MAAAASQLPIPPPADCSFPPSLTPSHPLNTLSFATSLNNQSYTVEAAEDPNQAPPSSMGSSLRPKARPLQRTISTASARSYLDDSDDDMLLPSGSQLIDPASSQPPPSPRPKPRPKIKRNHCEISISGSDSDSDAISSFGHRGKRRKGPLAQPLLDKVHKNAKIEPGTRMGMCSLHNEEASIILQGKAQGWPAAEDFVWDFWEEIFFEGKSEYGEGEYGWIMRQMCDRVINPSSSQWLKACQEKPAKDGTGTVTSAKGLMETMEDEQTGYFGEVGAAKMLEWLRRAFIDQRIPESNNPYPDSDLQLDADHKQASLYPLSISSFISRCLVPELACCFIRVLDDCDFEEANQIRLQSSAYGSAILPVLAGNDVRQFLDFDLDRDTGMTTPSSVSRLSAPNAPSRRRSKRIEATVGSSPEARQKGKRESSQRGKPKSSQPRRGRKAAGTDSVFNDGAAEIVATGRSKAAEAAEDPNQAPPSSMESSFRPKARPLWRIMSTASARSYLDDSDDDMSLPSGSQLIAPASSQPSLSQRPKPRSLAKRNLYEISVSGSDSDSNAVAASQSSFSKALGKKRNSPPLPRESFEIIPNPSQGRSESGGPWMGSSKLPKQLEMAGSSQDPISLLGSEDSEFQAEEDDGHVTAVAASSGTKLYAHFGLDRRDFLEVPAADTDLFPLSQGSAGLDELQAPPSAQPPRMRNDKVSMAGSDSNSDAVVADQSSLSKAKGKKLKDPPLPRDTFEIIPNPSQGRSESGGPWMGSSKLPKQLEMAGSSQDPIFLLGSEDSELQAKEDDEPVPAVAASSGAKLLEHISLDPRDCFEVPAADTDLFPFPQRSAGLDEHQAQPSAQSPRIRSRAGSASGGPWYDPRVGDLTRAPNIFPQSFDEARVDPQSQDQDLDSSDADGDFSPNPSHNGQSNTTAAQSTSPGDVRDLRLAPIQQDDTRPGHPSLPHSSAAEVNSGRSSPLICRPAPFRLAPGTIGEASSQEKESFRFIPPHQQRLQLQGQAQLQSTYNEVKDVQSPP